MTRKTLKITLLAVLVLPAISSRSDAQLTRFGGGLSFSTGIENINHKTGNPGINVRAVYELGEKWWIVPGLTFYMPGKRQSNTYGLSTTIYGTIDGNVVYAMAHEGSILFYALAGPSLSLLSTSFESDDFPVRRKAMPALNVGTGIEMIVEKNLNAFAQIRGVIGGYSQYLVIGIGVHYYITGRRFKTW